MKHENYRGKCSHIDDLKSLRIIYGVRLAMKEYLEAQEQIVT